MSERKDRALMRTGTKLRTRVKRFLSTAGWIWFWSLNMFFSLLPTGRGECDETAVSLFEAKSVCGLFWPAGPWWLSNSVYNNFNYSAAVVEQIIVIYLIEN